jgi:hypothetical protein
MNRALLLCCATALSGCGANIFHVDVKGEATIAGSPLGGLLNAFPTVASFTNIDFNENQEFKNQGVTKDQVNSVKVAAIQLKILTPPEQDYSFLDTLQFFARTGDSEVLVAEKTGIGDLNIQGPNAVLNMDIKDVELKPYVTAPTMSIIVRGKGRQPSQDTKLEANVRLRVDVKIL